MSPPHVPGIPGMQLPETPEQKRLTALEKRVTELEQQMSGAREKLDSINEFDEDSLVAKIEVPSDAPKAGKVWLRALQGIPVQQRAFVLVVAIVVGALVVTVLALHGFKVI